MDKQEFETLQEARRAIAVADKAGDSKSFTALGFKYGPIAL